MKKRTNTLSAAIFIAMLLATVVFAQATQELNKFELLQRSLENRDPYVGPVDTPPPGPVIAVAEWEPATGVLITYPLWLPLELVAEMAEDAEVVTVLADEAMMELALQEYTSAGVDTSNCSFLFMGDTSTPWTRDCGPWYVFDANDQQGLIDNLYMDMPAEWVPRALGDTLGIPVYGTGLSTEGGNYMTDGMGTAIDEEWLLMENPDKTLAEINVIYEEYLGITNHLIMQLTGYHIDTWAKFLDPGRILVIEPRIYDPEIEENVELLQSLMSSYGRPYEIIRVQGSGYSNSLILNNKVLVPLPGDPTDSLALVTFQEAMPGYEVHGYEYPGGQHAFHYFDALHCRTHEMADRYMLRIVHVPIHDRENAGGGYVVEANIHPYSNEPLIGPPVIMWKTEGGSYNPVAMTFVGDDIYTGEIPQQPDGTDIYYYIEAEDGSGRLEHHPYIGEGNPHHFNVGPDNEAPVVEFDPPATLTVSDWPYAFSTYVLDNRWISSVMLEWSVNGVTQADVDMLLREPYAVFYRGVTEGTIQPGDVIEVRVKAVDTSVNQNTTYSDYFTISIEGMESLAININQYKCNISPNPFNPTTTINFDLPVASYVTLNVFDISGSRVGVGLVPTRLYTPGRHSIQFDGSNLTSGVYIYRLTTETASLTGKMVLMK